MNNSNLPNVVLYAVETLFYLVLVIVNKRLQGLMTGIGDAITNPFATIKDYADKAHETIRESDPRAKEALKNFKEGVNSILQSIVDGLQTVIQILQDRAKSVLELLESDYSLRGWRILGSLLQFVFLGLFIYADLVQGINNYSTLFPDVLKDIPSWLQNLYIPIVISSAGTAAVLSMLVGDFLGLTHFVKWEKLSPLARNVIFWATLINFMVTLIFAGFIAWNRLPYVTGVTLSPDRAENIHLFASIGQSFSILPLLVTTFLLFYSLSGLFILWWFLAILAIVPIFLLKLVFQFIKILIMLGGVGIVSILKIFFILLLFLLSVGGLILTVIISAATNIFKVINGLLNVITFPPRWIFGLFDKKPFEE